jgi:regulator of nucleoside diphosphate kinase
MAQPTKKNRKPAIAVTRTDSERLWRIAESFASRNPAVAEELLAELDRAKVVEDGRLAPDVVRMGSSLRFTSDLGEDRNVTLVFPGEADIAEGKVSVLTPIGVALIGLSAGQSIDWTARDGRVHRLTVETVQPPGCPLRCRQTPRRNCGPRHDRNPAAVPPLALRRLPHRRIAAPEPLRAARGFSNAPKRNRSQQSDGELL